MEKNIFLKLEFKSFFSTKKYWYTMKDKQQFEMIYNQRLTTIGNEKWDFWNVFCWRLKHMRRL